VEARRIERAGTAGEVALRLPPEEQTLLLGLANELRSGLETSREDPSLRRLFPPAYDDEQDEHAYRELAAESLLDGRRRSLEVLAETVGRDQLSATEADAWLRALNDLRLALGTRLDVQEDSLVDGLDPDDPAASGLAVYAYLSWLQEQLVEALSLDA
jgi:Domain of unknown function (DUF2017)